MIRTVLDMLIGAVVYVGLVTVWDAWLRSTRGEFHCPVCKHVSPLPKDDDQ